MYSCSTRSVQPCSATAQGNHGLAIGFLDVVGCRMSKIVLVVEDEVVIREMTVELLEDAGLAVAQAGNADEALRILEDDATEISLLFTDVRMPGQLDGLDLARHVLDRWPHIKVIVTSGMFTRSVDTIPLGADFLPKPWLPLEMLMKMTRGAVGFC